MPRYSTQREAATQLSSSWQQAPLTRPSNQHHRGGRSCENNRPSTGCPCDDSLVWHGRVRGARFEQARFFVEPQQPQLSQPITYPTHNANGRSSATADVCWKLTGKLREVCTPSERSYRHVTTFITDTGILVVRLRRAQRNGGVEIGEDLLECAGSTWESSTKTCTPPAVEEKPGAPNNGNAEWVTETTIEAHGQAIKNKFTGNDNDVARDAQAAGTDRSVNWDRPRDDAGAGAEKEARSREGPNRRSFLGTGPQYEMSFCSSTMFTGAAAFFWAGRRHGPQSLRHSPSLMPSSFI